MKTYRIVYWVFTVIIALMIGLGSLADIFMIAPVRASYKLHGFPEHFLPYFGFTKFLASLVILVPAFRRYREVAYGGLFFYFVGAVYSHVAIGDSMAQTWSAAVALLSVVGSYACWLKMEQIKLNQQKATPGLPL